VNIDKRQIGEGYIVNTSFGYKGSHADLCKAFDRVEHANWMGMLDVLIVTYRDVEVDGWKFRDLRNKMVEENYKRKDIKA